MGQLLVKPWEHLRSIIGDEKLPATLAQAFGQLDAELDAQAAFPGVTPLPSHRPADVEPLDWPARHEELRAQHDAEVKQQRAHGYAVSVRRERISTILTSLFDDLCHDIRPDVTALVEEARPIVAASSHDDAFVLAHGDANALQDNRTYHELDATFRAYVAAWQAGFVSAVDGAVARGLGPDARHIASYLLNPAFRYWTDPSKVLDNRVSGRLDKYGNPFRGRIPPSVTPGYLSLAAVAAEPVAAGFRLATVAELVEVWALVKQSVRGTLAEQYQSSVMWGVGHPTDRSL